MEEGSFLLLSDPDPLNSNVSLSMFLCNVLLHVYGRSSNGYKILDLRGKLHLVPIVRDIYLSRRRMFAYVLKGRKAMALSMDKYDGLKGIVSLFILALGWNRTSEGLEKPIGHWGIGIVPDRLMALRTSNVGSCVYAKSSLALSATVSESITSWIDGVRKYYLMD
uniref:Reverse transcriptase n=1 Tax=Ascaris lumbricoides TaxID=6252 RepID=A0A0M3IPL1_ASCLU